MKRKGRENMNLAQASNNKRKKRKIPNRLSNMSRADWKEANEVTKRERGLSKLSYTDIYGEEK